MPEQHAAIATVKRLLRGLGNSAGSEQTDGCHWQIDSCRWIVAICQATTIVLTWTLWQARLTPPVLPARWCPLPPFDTGILLLASLGLVVLWPKRGGLVHAALLAVSMAMDQTRMQPQVISCAILLLATTPTSPRNLSHKQKRALEKSATSTISGWLLLGRVHLISLWFYSGFHKLICSDYYVPNPGAFLTRMLGDLFSDWQMTVVSGLAALLEMAIAILILWPRFRQATCILAGLLHLGILGGLISLDWNSSVWSWNVALLPCIGVFFWSWRESFMQMFKAANTGLRTMTVLILVMPLGYYLEWTDCSLSHCLYSRNKAMGFSFHHKSGSPQLERSQIGQLEHLEILNAPLPHEHRLIVDYFAKSQTTQIGDILYIYDPRVGAKLRGRSERWFFLDKDRKAIATGRPAGARGQGR